MKIDKDDLFMAALLGGLVVCSPFIALYHAGKWIYGKTPKGVKERKAKEKKQEEMNRKQEEITRKMNQEIHELEKQLGFTYDPFYVGNRHRGKYLSDLKKKIASGYKSPDRILMIEETSGERGPALYRDHQVLLLLHKDSYNISEILSTTDIRASLFLHNNYDISGIGLPRADMYVKNAQQPGYVIGLFSRRFRTLSECGNYQDYYVFPVPGRFDYQSVLEGKCDDLNKFIVDFDRKYKISSDGSETSEKKEQ